MLTLTGNVGGYVHDEYDPGDGKPIRYTHKLTVNTQIGTVFVLVPHDLHLKLMAVPEGRLLSQFGTMVEILGLPCELREYGKVVGAGIEAHDFASIVEVQLVVSSANGNG